MLIAEDCTTIVPRDYQLETLTRVEEAFKKVRKVLLVAPCGAGKTVMAAEYIKRAVENADSVIFLAHRIELVRQTNAKLKSFGVEHGTIMAGYTRSMIPDVQVASIQTLSRRLNGGRTFPPPADLIIIDECHHTAANSYRKILETYPEARVLGLTATPIRSDGVGLGGPGMFEEMVYAPTIKELTDMGHLVPIKYYAPSKPDLEKVKLVAGEYNLRQLENKMDQEKLVGDIVTNFTRICPDRRAVVFSTGVRHSKHIRDMFLETGILAEHIDAKTPKDERKEILDRLQSGETQVVSNCMVLTEGWDCPPVSCIILARPTKSLGLYLQMAGRGLRPDVDTGKVNAILIDHSGAVYDHGRVEEEREWSLDPYEKIQGKSKNKKEGAGSITCGQCKFVYESLPKCPECGWMPVTKAKEFMVVEGDLGELADDGNWTGKKDTDFERQRFFQELMGYGKQKGHARGFAASVYRNRYSEWPPSHYAKRPLPPGPATTAWIKKEQRAYFRNKNK